MLDTTANNKHKLRTFLPSPDMASQEQIFIFYFTQTSALKDTMTFLNLPVFVRNFDCPDCHRRNSWKRKTQLVSFYSTGKWRYFGCYFKFLFILKIGVSSESCSCRHIRKASVWLPQLIASAISAYFNFYCVSSVNLKYLKVGLTTIW